MKGMCDKHRLESYHARKIEKIELSKTRYSYTRPMRAFEGNRIRTEKHFFLKECLESDTDKCIEWPFDLKNGMGYVKYDSREYSARRFLCIVRLGERSHYSNKYMAVPTKNCTIKNCCNPKHSKWKRAKIKR